MSSIIPRNCKRFCVLACLAGWLYLPPAVSQAALTLTIDDLSRSGVEVNITDDGLGDLEPTTEGLLLYSGAIGKFSVVVTTAMSKPVLGNIHSAQLDMVTVTVSGGAGTLEFKLTDNDYTLANRPGPAALSSTVDGSTAGTVDFQSYLNFDNQLFGLGETTGLQGPFTGVFTDAASMPVMFLADEPFSLTQVVHVTHTGAWQTTNFHILTEAHAPEPGSLAVWSLLGVVCAGTIWRRRR